MHVWMGAHKFHFKEKCMFVRNKCHKRWFNNIRKYDNDVILRVHKVLYVGGNEIFDKKIHERVKALRKESRITQEQLAQYLEVSGGKPQGL